MRRFLSVTQEFEVASWGSGRCMSCSCRTTSLDAEYASVVEGTISASSASCLERSQNQQHGDGKERVEVVLASDAFAWSWTRVDGQFTEVDG